eukprot:TRINITY_DN15020_c0_g1_i1.p1 TRINITY_DN15020_c0_g1~~TRINITY_DN15020_c0_g1_i1.p1  ORF type:complete len:350 (+),score=45.97 TRINITY_DN15020_c0_g1_i1:99-1148(+)
MLQRQLTSPIYQTTDNNFLLGNRYLLAPYLIGRGSQGQIRTAFDIFTEESVAVKMVPLHLTTTEPINHRHVSGSSNVVKFIDLIQDQCYQYQVMSLINGPSLVEVLEERDRLDESTTRRICQDIVAGLKNIHRLGVAHLDLKLENVMFDFISGEALLIDFGFSAAFDPRLPCPQVWQRAGSLHYSAPEIVSSEVKGYDPRAADMWSLGVVLYVLAAGFFPFDDETASEGSENPRLIFTKKSTGSYRFPVWFSPDLTEVISGLLVPEPHRRLTLEQVAQTRWFRGSLPIDFSSGNYQESYSSCSSSVESGNCYYYCPPSREEEESFYGLIGHSSADALRASFSLASAFAG